MFTRILSFAIAANSLFAAAAISQPEIEWQRSLGGSSVDCAYSILQTTDGGYIALGHAGSLDGDVTGNHGGLDFWVTKVDRDGNLEWEHSYGGSDYEEAYSMQETKDGGYILAGYSESDDGDVTGHHGYNYSYDCWIVKIDNAGNLIWERSLGGTADDYFYSVNVTDDGGYICAGYTRSNDGDVLPTGNLESAWVVKLNDLGSIEWQRVIGGTSGESRASCAAQTKDNGYIVVGTSSSTDGDFNMNYGNEDGWMIKLNSAGATEWLKTYGGSMGDELFSVREISDGYIAAGASMSTDGDLRQNNGDQDFWILRTTASGDIRWSKTYGGSSAEVAECIYPTKDGGCVVSGHTSSGDGDVTGFHSGGLYDQWDGWVVKLTFKGDLEWERTFGGTSLDDIYDLKQTPDGGYILVGSNLSDDGDVIGHHEPVKVSDFWIIRLKPPQTIPPSVLGFQNIPASLACFSVLDSVHIFFPSPGTFTVTNLSISGKDNANFILLVSSPLTIDVQNSIDLPVPIRFTPSSGTPSGLYNATVDITIHNNDQNIDYTFSVPVSGYSIDKLLITITTRFTNPYAYAGDDVLLPIEWSYEPKNTAATLDGLNIREISLDFSFNPNVLDITNHDLAAAFQSTIPGWVADPFLSTVNEQLRYIHLVLRGNTPLPDSVRTIGTLSFKAVLNDKDSISNFSMTRCNVISGTGDEVIGPCGTLSSISDTIFTELPQCGDSLIKALLRGEEINPISVISVSPNPATGRSVTFDCVSRIEGDLDAILFDMNGNAVKHFAVAGKVKKGEFRISTELNGLASGKYIYDIRCDKYRATGNLVLSK